MNPTPQTTRPDSPNGRMRVQVLDANTQAGSGSPTGRSGPVVIDPNRMFYRVTSQKTGGFRMDFADYETYPEQRMVRVIFSGGHATELTGRDAHHFLKIVQDKDRNLFAPEGE